MKKLLIVTTILLVGCTTQPDFGATKEELLLAEQEAYKDINGKYEQKLTETVGDLTTRIDEYKSAEGVGYQVYETEIRKGDGVYERSFGKGLDSISRSYDWTLIKDLSNATTTK